MKTATAFSPGHISGFFEPHYDKDFKKTGSVGAGFSISLGVASKVIVEFGKKQELEVIINNKPETAITTKMAIKNLIGDYPAHIKVEMNQPLPSSQGFGMSAAGALSAALATAKIFGLKSTDAIVASHKAEIECKTGLGDVIAESFGGIEIRRSPGLPPWGMIEHISGNYEIILSVIGDSIPTESILKDTRIIDKIKSYGKISLASLLEDPSIENLFLQSRYFAKETGLLSEKMEKVIELVEKHGRASMCMLGNSIFAIGETNKLIEMLSMFGNVYRCSIDQYGARVL